MKKEIIFLILVIGFLLVLGGLEFLLKEKSSEPEFTNHPPKVETRGTGVGCGIAVAEMFWFVSDSEDFMSAYQVQIDDNEDFSNCSGENCVFDTGKENNIKETLQQYDSTYKFLLSEKLSPAIYFWRVKVWDSRDAVSNWAQAILHLDR